MRVATIETEVSLNGVVFSVVGASNTNWQHLESSSGTHYCCGNGCHYCDASTPGNDAHSYESELPLEDFTDDQGNRWQYSGIVRSDSSSDFGWSDETHRWHCENPVYREKLDIDQLRSAIQQKVESASDWALLKLAEILQIQP